MAEENLGGHLQMTGSAPICYRVSQVAALLNLPVRTVYDLVRRRLLASVRIGEGRKKLTLIPAEAVSDLLKRYGVPAKDRGGKR
jgi:excisionase family DNA binding protein